MSTLDLLDTIIITLDKKTLDVLTVINGNNNKLNIKIGQNIFDCFKCCKPIFVEYPNLNILLMQLKLYQKSIHLPDNLVLKFSNSFDFYKLNLSVLNDGNEIIEFVIEFYPLENKLVIKGYGSVKNHKLTTNQLKHELYNSLNLINMSNILINNSIQNNCDQTNTNIAKYTDIIKHELDNSTYLLNNLTDIEQQNKYISLYEFCNYIKKYMHYINDIYSVFDDGNMDIQPLSIDTLTNLYVNVNLNWFKIILDNIFKNIYGHIGDISNKKFKLLTIKYNAYNNKLMLNIVNSTTDDTIPISNKPTSPKRHIKHAKTSTNIPASLIDTSVVQEIGISGCKKVLEPNVCKINLVHSQGINLISSLCDKLGVTWRLIQLSTTDCGFYIDIPVINKIDGCKPIHTTNDVKASIPKRNILTNLI